MSLSEEIQQARKDTVSDGYAMSVGEIINLYKDKEIKISPPFQRLFRWDLSRKTRFIESLLLGIPVPPIFVYQDEDGVWELIDGLQRLSTIFEFVGILRLADCSIAEPTILEGTKSLPSLADKYWEASSVNIDDGIGSSQQIQIKRARMRVEILKPESDPRAKYELFQRLNTGGVELTEQEVRNCIALMINKKFHFWLLDCASNKDFLTTIDQTENALEKQSAVELALRFIVFRKKPYQPGLDVHEYLDEAMIDLALDNDFDFESERATFNRTFSILNQTLDSRAFKRWDNNQFSGKFLMSVFEVIAISLSKNLGKIEKLDPKKQKQFIEQKAKDLWSNPKFTANSGAGIRGTTRLKNLLPMTDDYLRL